PNSFAACRRGSDRCELWKVMEFDTYHFRNAEDAGNAEKYKPQPFGNHLSTLRSPRPLRFLRKLQTKPIASNTIDRGYLDVPPYSFFWTVALRTIRMLRLELDPSLLGRTGQC